MKKHNREAWFLLWPIQKSKTDKQRIAELEARIRELEAENAELRAWQMPRGKRPQMMRASS